MVVSSGPLLDRPPVASSCGATLRIGIFGGSDSHHPHVHRARQTAPQSMSIPESDWKRLQALHRVALDRYCERVLQECSSLIADPSRAPHERYLALYKLIQERDDTLADAFNDLRRSTAISHLIAMRALRVITDEELEEFTPETRERVGVAARSGF